jgi:DNA adenine methylase
MVRDKAGSLLPLLNQHKERHGKNYYYEVRRQDPAKLKKLQRAARLIYLNKVCYNGLYRVNSKGQFNVPMGSYKNPGIFNKGNLLAASESLKGATLLSGDFTSVLGIAKRGDFIYFDPPYYSESDGFTGYAVTASGTPHFGADEHWRLFEAVKELSARGCSIIVSNSDTEYVRRIYKDFTLKEVGAYRLINRIGAGRGPVIELVITNAKSAADYAEK